jgi:TDG/mug DNA glycosylase family protein
MPVKPTAEELRAAVNGRTPDILKKNLRVVFCGINPSVYSVVVGHHFARPGNRFWKALHGGGFTPQLLAPHQDRELLNYGCGITNVVERATVAAADLSAEELTEGGKQLEAKIKKLQPQWLAVLGISAYRTAFHQPKAVLGLQKHTIGGAHVWVLPNPSGLNAHYHPPELARLFAEFREVIEENTLAD